MLLFQILEKHFIMYVI